MKRITVVLGTRPEAIKLCPLIRELKGRDRFLVSVCSTGQHRTMLDGALRAFDVVPNIDLNVMKPGQRLGRLYARILAGVEAYLRETCPDAVLVQGDTVTACAAAQAAFYMQIPVGHVEAGLRTYHMFSPFPEELHRRAIALMSEWHFAPTVSASKSLIRAGIGEKQIFMTGNTVVDALRFTLAKKCAPSSVCVPAKARLLVFTAHRREHLGKTLEGMFRALLRIVEEHKDVFAICPLHQNPSVRNAAAEILGGHDRIVCVDPPEVVEFHHLLARSDLIMTDSGGIPEEATALGIPTVVMRYSTERAEGIFAGNLRLAGSGEAGIVDTVRLLLRSDSELYESMKRPSRVFGEGDASVRIANALEKVLGERSAFERV